MNKCFLLFWGLLWFFSSRVATAVSQSQQVTAVNFQEIDFHEIDAFVQSEMERGELIAWRRRLVAATLRTAVPTR